MAACLTARANVSRIAVRQKFPVLKGVEIADDSEINGNVNAVEKNIAGNFRAIGKFLGNQQRSYNANSHLFCFGNLFPNISEYFAVPYQIVRPSCFWGQ